jgi:AcrR family transcriptional regulator
VSWSPSGGPRCRWTRWRQRAGVGNASLYRHFPTRANLLVAVYADEVERLARLGAEADLFTGLDA